MPIDPKQFDITAGLDLRQIPQAVRDAVCDEWGRGDTRSLAAKFNDPTLDRPACELVVGTTQRLARFFDVTDRQMRNIVRTMQAVGLLHLHRCGPIAITLVKSLHTAFRQHEDDKTSACREAGKRSGEERRARSDVSGGTSATATAPEALVQEERRGELGTLPPMQP